MTINEAKGFGITFGQTNPQTMAKTPRLPLPIPVRMGLVGQDGAAVSFRLSLDGPLAEEHVVLVTKTLYNRFSGNQGKTVPSLLCNFSAPVILQDDLTPSERLHLLAHDVDMLTVGIRRKHY